ncbi:MAG TPA: hypothetical protein VFZ17_08250 [Acidimicrobiia bacterium]|nr:hypothetical protein [Acidimicrobiia bacterium]
MTSFAPGSSTAQQHRDEAHQIHPNHDLAPKRSHWHPLAVAGRAGRGAVAGAIATVPMAAVQLAGARTHRARPSYVEVVRRAGKRLPHVHTPRGSKLAYGALALHVGFGAAAGALYAVVAPSRHRVATAPAFALIEHGVSYAGWVPKVGLMPAPTRDDPRRQAFTAAAHIVYGTTLAAVLDAFDRIDARRAPADDPVSVREAVAG